MPPDTNPVGKGYALWLMPGEPVFSILAEEISRLSREHSTVRFEPHVTLLAGIRLPEDAVMATSASLAGCLKPFRVELADVGYLEEYFRCLFVHVRPGIDILGAHRLACEAFGCRDESPYMPHASLLYGRLAMETKKEIATGLGWLSGRAFDVRSLLLYRVNGAVDEWKRVREFDLQ